MALPSSQPMRSLLLHLRHISADQPHAPQKRAREDDSDDEEEDEVERIIPKAGTTPGTYKHIRHH